MRIFILSEDFCEPFDISADQTLGSIKQMLKKYLNVQQADDKQVQQVVELNYAGGSLRDGWALCDLGIRPGAVIRCLIKNKRAPAIHLFNAVTGETLPVVGPTFLLSISVARLKTMISLQVGLPVSAFRLSTPLGVELYDCNLLSDYDIELGSTLRLDTWDGWVAFIQGCLRGHRSMIQWHLSDETAVMRFQLRVALYIAAFLGHLELADWLVERGMCPEQPVGVHPYRLWCHQTAHPDSSKCPIHVSLERGQLLILKLFISNSPLTLVCTDHCGCSPLQIAIKHGHKDCVRYLVSKLYSAMSLPKMSMTMRIYLKIKVWVRKGRRRAASKRMHGTRAATKARVGDTVLVDGFTQPKMSSQPGKGEPKVPRAIGANVLGPLQSHQLSKRPPHGKNLQLPSLSPLGNRGCKTMQRKLTFCGKKGVGVFFNEATERGLQDGRVALPPIKCYSKQSSLSISTALNSSHHCGGQTPKENAVYWLAIAREILAAAVRCRAVPGQKGCPENGLDIQRISFCTFIDHDLIKVELLFSA